MYNLLACFGECVGPIIAGLTIHYFGYELAYFMAGVFTVIFGLTYFFLCGFGRWPEELKTPILYQMEAEKNEGISKSEALTTTNYRSHFGFQEEEVSLLGRKTV